MRNKSRTELNFTRCGTENFNFEDKEEVLRYKIDDFTCLTQDSNIYTLQGNYYRANMDYVELKLWKCRNYTGTAATPPVGYRKGLVCKSQAEIDEHLR